MPELISTGEAAARTGLSRLRIQQLCKAGRISGARLIGRTWMIPDDFDVSPGSRGPPSKGISSKNFAAVMFLLELDLQCKILERGIVKLRESADHWKNIADHIDDGKKAPPIEIMTISIGALSAAAAIKRILHPCGRGSNRRIVKRCAQLRKLLGNPPTPTLQDLAVRDSWEHADERLDSVMRTRRRGTSISEIHVSATPPATDQTTLRRFDPNSFAIHYLGDSISLEAASAEAKLIEARIKDAFVVLRNEIVKLY